MNNPAVIAAVIPFLIALSISSAAQYFGPARPGEASGGWRSVIAAVGALIALFYVYSSLFGFPEGLPRTATQKLGYLIFGGLALGLLVKIAEPMGRPRRALLLLAPVAGLLWIAWPKIVRADSLGDAALLGGLFILVLLSLRRLSRSEPAEIDASGVQLTALATGLIAVTVLGRAASIGLLATGAAAALGGVMIWNLRRRRLAIPDALVFGFAVPLAGIVAQTALFTSANGLALALLALVFWIDALPLSLFRPLASETNGWRIIACGMSFVPVAAAIAIAAATGGVYGAY